MKVHQIFFFLLLLFLPTQLGAHVWPDWAMVLGRRVDYLSPTLYLTDILVALTVGSWIVHEVTSDKRQVTSKIKKWIQKYFVYLLIAVLFVAVNILFATNIPVAVNKWVKVLEFVLLGWYIIKTKPSLVSVISPLSIGVLYSSVLAIAQFFLQHSIGGPLWFLGERTFAFDTPGIARFDFNLSLFTYHFSLFGLRPYATFPHPNVLGGYLAAILPLVIIQLSNNQIFKLSNMNKQKIYYFITLILGMVTLVLTFSRSAIAVGGIGIGVGIWYVVFRKKERFSVTIFLCILVILFLAVLRGVNPAEESVVVRQQLNTAAITMWQQSPLVGVGLGNFLVELPKTLPSRSVYFLQPVHNIYLLILSEIGIVGLVMFIWIIRKITGMVISNKQKVTSQAKEKSVSLITYRLSLCSLLLLGLIDHYPLTLQQGQLLFVLIVSLNLFPAARKIDK